MIYEELSIDNELFGDLTNIAYLLSEDFFQRTLIDFKSFTSLLT